MPGTANGCFVEGTSVVTTTGPQTIESIQLGARVRTLDESACITSLDARVTWRTLTAEMDNPDDPANPIRFSMIQSLALLTALGAMPGSAIPTTLGEISTSGEARVLSITAAPRIEEGPGCIVMGRFMHVNHHVVRVSLANGTSLEVTENHPLYGVERASFVPTRDLAPGEHLRTPSGDVAVVALESIGGPYRVYNLDVEGAQTYLAGESQVWAHNNDCAVAALDRLRTSPATARRELRQGMEAMAPGSTAGGQTHHVVPVAEAGHEMLDLAARGGFNVSGTENGVLLTMIHRSRPGVRGGHPRYNAAVAGWMDRWMAANQGATAEQAANALRRYTDNMRRRLNRVDNARAASGDTRPLR